ncbi:MAG: hypothetical protein ACNI3C_09385 [Candidatus Marinarcus sp.]|uniref:hypothetical protein n=1 Tax=Candidatus Marinarcus sp. TaxID=3100987 RepID=UPI003B00A0F9
MINNNCSNIIDMNINTTDVTNILQNMPLQPDETTESFSVNTDEYLQMSYIQLDNLTFEEYKNYATLIKQNVQEKMQSQTKHSDDNLKFSVLEKLHAATYTNNDTVNKTIFVALSESNEHPLIFMTTLNNGVQNYINGNDISTNHGLLMPSTNDPVVKEKRSSINYRDFFSKAIENYKNLLGNFSEDIQMYASLLSNLNAEHESSTYAQ